MDVDKVYLTLQPQIKFVFDATKKCYILNVWYFLIGLRKRDQSMCFKPLFVLTDEPIHEYAHYQF